MTVASGHVIWIASLTKYWKLHTLILEDDHVLQTDQHTAARALTVKQNSNQYFGGER